MPPINNPGGGSGGGGSGTVTGVLGTSPIASDGSSTTPTISLVVGALPNGMTATTQAAGDATTKVATDGFVTTAVNNAIAGVNPAVAVVVATTQASDTSGLTYNNGVAGVGATLTGTNNTALVFDGVTLTSLTQRVLVKNDTQSPSGAFNGVYTLTQLQATLLPPILTRALDFDMPSDINSTGAIPVTSGTVNASTSWVVTSTVNTVGTDPITFTQFSINPANIVDLASPQTLTNKTLTTPGITSYTFATLPAASGVSGKIARVTDIGPATAGSLWISNGTIWKPVNGRVTLGTLATRFNQTAGSGEAVAFQVQLPAAFFTSLDRVRIYQTHSKAGATTTGTRTIKIGTAGTTSDAAINGTGGAILAAANRSIGLIDDISIRSATTAIKVGGGLSSTGTYATVTNSAYPTATTISNISNSLFVSVTITPGATDDVALEDCTMEYICI